MNDKRVGHRIDALVGNRIRQLRFAAGVSQMELAERLNLSYQQVQKYETAQNRISISRLWEIADALNVPMDAFFKDIDVLTCKGEGNLESYVQSISSREYMIIRQLRKLDSTAHLAMINLLSTMTDKAPAQEGEQISNLKPLDS